MKSPDISFIIIEYYSITDVEACVAAIELACTDISHEIIVSSNSTYSAEEQQRLKMHVSCVGWVFNAENGGFAHGMNAGLSCSIGKAVVILNPDVRMKSGSVREAYEFLEQHKDVGILGPRIVDSTGALQDTCRDFMGPWTLVRRIFARLFSGRDVLLEKCFDYSRIQAVDWVIGAFMMVRRDALKLVGGLDEGYFLYVEDMDWCKRFWDEGYQVIYYPLLTVEYKGDRKSTAALFSKKMVDIYGFYHFKSFARFLMKHGFLPKRLRKS